MKQGVTISSFRDLDVWKDAVDLAEKVYRATTAFPGDERFGLTSQIRRAATSVASNIAEGHARNSTREFLQFVAIALGSLAEVETQWEIASRVLRLADEGHTLCESIAHLRARLLNLRSALLRRIQGVAEDEAAYQSEPIDFLTGEEASADAVPVPRAPCPVPRI
jgi:four helix bundle protein